MATRNYSRLSREQRRKIVFGLACRMIESAGSTPDLAAIYRTADKVTGRDTYLSERTIAGLRREAKARYRLEMRGFAEGAADYARGVERR